MLKEFIAHIQKTTQPLIHEVEGATFVINAEGEYQEMLPTIFHPDTLSLNSLDALVKLVKTEASEMDTPTGLLRGPRHRCARLGREKYPGL